MKRFLLKTFLMAFTIIVVAIVFEYSLRQIPTQYTVKYAYMEEQKQKIEILVLGHSESAQGINPVYMGENCYNFAINGKDIFYDFYYLKKYIPEMKQLRYVVYPYAYNILSSTRYPVPNITLDPNMGEGDNQALQFELYMDAGLYTFPVNHIECLQDVTAVQKWKKYYLRKQNTVICDSLGFQPLEKKDRVANWRTSFKPHEYDFNHPNYELANQEKMDCLMGMAYLCQEYGVRFVLVGMPVTYWFYSLYRPEKIKKYYDDKGKILAKYPNTLFLDYQQDPRFEEEDFYNPNHLCHEGADKFSKILSTELGIR